METWAEGLLGALVCGEVGAGDRVRELKNGHLCAQVNLRIWMGAEELT